MRFRIEYSPESIEEIESLPKNIQGLVKRAIVERLMVDPISYGKPLKYSLKGTRSLRVSSYRILYQIIMEHNLVRIIKVAIRRDVYE